MASKTRARKDKTEKVLRPVRPNLGIEIAYRKRLDALIEEMSNSCEYWISAAYRANEPAVAELAQDELSAAALKRVMRELSKRWLKRFDEAADKLADYFATAVHNRSDAALKKILKDGGISVQWRMTSAQRDIMQATISEQVNLIKSIPQKYLTQVEGIVMRGVQTGRDLGQITKDLHEQTGVTKRRAAFIAKDQSNKATASMTRARYLEIGVQEAIWVHSGGGKEPRKTHLAAGREKQRYDVATGWFDPDPKVKRYVAPGELINCRCVARPVVKGFS